MRVIDEVVRVDYILIKVINLYNGNICIIGEDK